MDLKNKYTGGFYLGKMGPWIPIILMVIGLIVGTKIGGGGILRFSLITFLAVIAGFFLTKDKKNFGKVAISGLTNSMLAIIIIAFLSAGVLGQLLRQSGLIEALVHTAGSVNFDAGFLPLISFVICAIISTSCGTSSGSITAMAPVMLPLAVGMGCSPGLVCGRYYQWGDFRGQSGPDLRYHHWFGLDTGSAGGRCGQNEAALFSHSRRNFSCSLCCAGQCDDGKPRHGRRCHRSRFKVSSSSGSASDYDYHDQKRF